jgi:hypothetical protein
MSELDLLRQSQSVIDLDPKVTDRALDLSVSEKQLDRSKIASLAIDLRRIGAPHRMCAISAAVHPAPSIQPRAMRAYWCGVT